MIRLPRPNLRWFAQDRGIAAVEFAIILPLLMLLVLGGYEGWRLVLAGQRIDRVSYTLSDLASRLGNVSTEGEISNLLEGGSYVAKPFDLHNNGRIILSAVDAAGSRPIIWQRCLGNAVLASSLGVEGADANLANLRRAPASADAVLYVTEVKMQYYPPLSGVLYNPVTLSRTAVVPGRLSIPTAINAGGPVSGC